MRCPSSAIHWRNATKQSFCGRDELIADIEQGLDRSDSFAVLGQRGMGKSMLLHQIRERRQLGRLPDPVCLIVKCSGRETSPFTLVTMVENSLVSALADYSREDEHTIRCAVGAGMKPVTARPLLRLIRNAESLIGQPLSAELFFDDFHRLGSLPWVQDWLANLEHELFGHPANARLIRAVLCGDLRMKALLEQLRFSDLWYRLRDVWLQPLSTKELTELLERIDFPAPLGSPVAMADLLDTWAGGHPALTQYLLADLLEHPSRDSTEVVESSATRFLGELTKLLEASWGGLDENVQSLIRKVAVSSGPVGRRSLQSTLSMDRSWFRGALKAGIASGFIRTDADFVLPPGRVVLRWLDVEPRKPPVPQSYQPVAVQSAESCPDFPTILHISDLHFGGIGHAWDQPKEIPGVGRPPHDRVRLLDTICQDLRELGEEDKGWCPGVIVVSGDLLFECRREGIEQAVTFLSDLSAELQIERSRIVLCAGNHEQSRSIFREEPMAQLASYRNIWNAIYPSGSRRLPLEWKPGSYTHVYRIENLEILSLNSCEDLDPDPEPDGTQSREQGYISLQQLRVAEDLLVSEEPPPGCVRVAVLHHHLSQHRWTTGVDYSILREVERVIRWLRQFHFDLILHGHQRCVGLQTRVQERRYMTIVAAGSAGVSAEHRWRGGMPLTYQLICGSGANKTVRNCRVFDLFAETWIPSPHEENTSIPIGSL